MSKRILFCLHGRRTLVSPHGGLLCPVGSSMKLSETHSYGSPARYSRVAYVYGVLSMNVMCIAWR